MKSIVKCWHCEHYVWYSDDDQNKTAICDVKNRRVAEFDEVCEEFILHKGIYTKSQIPNYCKHYKRD